MNGFIGVIIGLVVLFFLWLLVWVPLFGFNYETGRGEHTGYITAVERGGVFFKTGRAYLKTDTQSSQEDDYCVIDPAVYKQLQEYSTTRQHLNVYFYSLFSAGVAQCNAEGDIIYKVVPITD